MHVVLLGGVVNAATMSTPLPPEKPAVGRPEFVVRKDGRLELRHPDQPGEWIATDEPVEIVR